MGLSKTALLLCVLESFSVFAGDYEVVVDFGLRILESLKRRIDPKTGLAKPDWRALRGNCTSVGRPSPGRWSESAKAARLRAC